jgi:hypothetical protein
LVIAFLNYGLRKSFGRAPYEVERLVKILAAFHFIGSRCGVYPEQRKEASLNASWLFKLQA